MRVFSTKDSKAEQFDGRPTIVNLCNPVYGRTDVVGRERDGENKLGRLRKVNLSKSAIVCY